MEEVTRVLNQEPACCDQAAEELLPALYDELRELAASRMAGEWETSTQCLAGGKVSWHSS